MTGILTRWRAWRRRRYWTAERQLENLRNLVQGDYRWLAHDRVADALTTRYMAALAPDWYSRVHMDPCHFRRSIGLEPVTAFTAINSPERLGCIENGDDRHDPRGCWNVRCQLGKRCCRQKSAPTTYRAES